MTGKKTLDAEESAEPQRDGSSPHDRAEEEERVGPGRPPKQYTWKKGGPTPNPTGRRGKNPSIEPDLKKLFEEVFFKKKVKLTTKDQKQRVLTRVELGLEQLANQFAKGDRHARRDVFAIADKLGVDMLAGARKTIEALTPDHQAILDAYINRRTGNADAAQTGPVIAPPELLDDDVAQPDPAANQTTPPSASSDPPPAKLPRTPQDIRAARLQRLKRQTEFEAASAAAEPAPVDPTSVPPQTVAIEPASAWPATHSPKPEPAPAPMVPPTMPVATPTAPADATASSFSADEKSFSTGEKSSLDARTLRSAPGPNNPLLPKRPMTAQELHDERLRLKRGRP